MTQPPDDASPSWPPPSPAGLQGPPYAAASSSADFYVDPESGLTLPAGVQLASIGRRIGAYFLAIPLVIVTLGIGYVIWGLVLWGQGTTPALKVLGMRCWRPETRQVPGFWYMALREIVGRFVEGILSFLTALVSFILFVTGRERKSLHDHIAGTVVLYDPDGRLPR